jgi:hypothetical protein
MEGAVAAVEGSIKESFFQRPVSRLWCYLPINGVTATSGTLNSNSRSVPGRQPSMTA